MWRKIPFVILFLLSSLALSWGEARPLATTQDSLGTNEVSTMTPSELWQRADESLKIIEESLITQGEPVENLSKSLPELYQKSQELQESVNALSQRLESLEEYLNNFIVKNRVLSFPLLHLGFYFLGLFTAYIFTIHI